MGNIHIARELVKIAKNLVAIEFDTQDAYDKYMKDHPDADKSNHRVKKTERKEPAKKEKPAKKETYSWKNEENMSPEDYAGLWGSTSGQGAAHFFNYSSERQKKDDKFYDEFINGKGGIKDTIAKVKSIPDSFEKGDLENLTKLLNHVESERKELKSKKSSSIVARELLTMAKEMVSASGYQNLIRQILVRMGHGNVDPRHVEAYLRLKFRNLDGLSKESFAEEIPEIVDEIRKNPRAAEEIADSYWL